MGVKGIEGGSLRWADGDFLLFVCLLFLLFVLFFVVVSNLIFSPGCVFIVKRFVLPKNRRSKKSAIINPFTAPACKKNSRLKSAHTSLQNNTFFGHITNLLSTLSVLMEILSC